MPESREYIIFKLDDIEYGLEIQSVVSVEQIFEITRVPFVEQHIIGIVNLRGNIIPVIDLRRLFDLETVAPDDDSRFVIVNEGENVVGLLVDSASITCKIDTANIERAPDSKGNKKSHYVKEIGRCEDRIVMLLSLQSILGQDEE